MPEQIWPAPPVYTMCPQDLVGREFDSSGMRWVIVECDESTALYCAAELRALPRDGEGLHTMRRDTAEVLVKSHIANRRPPTPTPQPDETGSAS